MHIICHLVVSIKRLQHAVSASAQAPVAMIMTIINDFIAKDYFDPPMQADVFWFIFPTLYPV